MCYNKNCDIEIKSCIDGETSNISVSGEITKTPNEYRFDYTLDGDKCTLTVTDGKVIQTRRGEQNIDLTFIKGEKSECVLDMGGLLGTVPVFTEDIRHDICSINRRFGAVCVFMLAIVYTLDEQKTKINFSAKYSLKVKK